MTNEKVMKQMYGALAINTLGSAMLAAMTSPWVMIGPLVFSFAVIDMYRLISKESNK